MIADEREDVQKKTFAKWINSQLLKVRDEYILSHYLILYCARFIRAIITQMMLRGIVPALKSVHV